MATACVNPPWCQSLQRRARVVRASPRTRVIDDDIVNRFHTVWFRLNIDEVLAEAYARDDAKTLRCVLKDRLAATKFIALVERMFDQLGEVQGATEALKFMMQHTVTSSEQPKGPPVSPFSKGGVGKCFQCVMLELGYGDTVKAMPSGCFR